MKTVEEYIKKYNIPNEFKVVENEEDCYVIHFIDFTNLEKHKVKFNSLFPMYIDYFISGDIAVRDF